MSKRRTSNSRFTMPRNVSQNFSHEEMQRLNLRFRKLDKDHSGTLSVSELMVLPDIPKNKLIYRDIIAIAALLQTLSFFPIKSKFCKVVLTTIFSGSHIEKIHKNGKLLGDKIQLKELSNKAKNFVKTIFKNQLGVNQTQIPGTLL